MARRPVVRSVLVGIVVITGLALGEGAASAADNDACTVPGGTGVAHGLDCIIPGTDQVLGLLVDAVAPGVTGTAGAVTGSPDASTTTGPGSTLPGTSTGPVAGASGGSATGAGAGVVVPPRGRGHTSGGGGSSGSTAGLPYGGTAPHQEVGAVGAAVVAPARVAPAPAAAAVPAAPVVAPVPGLGLGPVVGAPTLRAPTGAAGLTANGSLFSGARYDPAALLGSPAALPLNTLLAGNPALSVTTASQVQAIALEGQAGHLGTPTTLAVLALSALIALVVRHRVTSRRRGRDERLVVADPDPVTAGTAAE